MANDVTLDRLRELGARRGRPAISLRLDLDPAHAAAPPARATAIASSLDRARREVDSAGDALPHEAKTRLRGQLEDLRRQLDPKSLGSDGTRGLAVFCLSDAEEPELLRLPAPVEDAVALDEAPRIAPLTRFARVSRWCVALVDRRQARFLLGDEHGLREAGALDDGTPGHHDQGGWSQARYQRSIELEADRHLDHVAEVLERGLRRGRFDRLLLAGAEPLRHSFEQRLAPEVGQVLAGWVDADLSAPDLGAVENAVAEKVRGVAHGEATEALRRLEAALGMPEGRAAAGLEGVLAALNEHRVAELLLTEGLAAPGTRCPSCGWLGIEGPSACPADGTTLANEGDVVDAAVAAALAQSAEVRPYPADELQLASHGRIAALLRF